MAQKEIAIKIKVDGKEFDAAKLSVDQFQKLYQETSKKLNSLPIGSAEWKALNSEIKNADKTFQQTKEIAGEVEGKFKSLRVQIRQATIAFQEAEEKGDIKSMKKLKGDLDNLNDQFELTTLKAMKFEDALATMPGVAGFVGQSIQGIDKAFKVLVANPILALVTGLVGAFMFLKEALGKTKEGTAALNKVSQALSTIMGPLLALINTVAVPIFEKLAMIIGKVGEAFAFFAEKLGVSKKSIADATKDVDKVGQEAAEAEKKRQEDAAAAAEKEAQRKKEAADKAKAAFEAEKKRQQDNINGNESLLQSQQELDYQRTKGSEETIESIQKEQAFKDKEYAREKKRIEDLRKVRGTTASEDKALVTELNNLEKGYLEDKLGRTKTLNDKRLEQIQKEKEFADKVREIQIAAIADETQRSIADREKKRTDDLAKLEEDKEFIKKSEQEKAEIRKNVNTAADADIKKINDDKKKKDQDAKLKELDDELKFLQIKGETIRQGTQAYFDNQFAILDAALKRELAATELTESQRTIITEKYANLRKKLKEEEALSYVAAVGQTIDAVAKLAGAIASSYDEEAKTSEAAFNKRKQLQLATAYLSAASGIIQILTQPSTLPSPFDWITKGINAVALGVTSAVQISNIKKTQFQAPSAGGGASSASALGKNYADGGLLRGPRHAQGGMMIEAEGGEAVMTRGAVTMFAPLLSAMNQMGGGTSFSNSLTTGNDNPRTSNPAQEQAPVIMKTYVVSNELTTEAERQARLKDLSTL